MDGEDLYAIIMIVIMSMLGGAFITAIIMTTYQIGC